jgi:methyl-accepting chemotaxis protein
MKGYGDSLHTWAGFSVALRDKIGRLAARTFTSQIFISAGVFVFALALLFGTIIAHSITKPLNAITETVKALAAGDLDQYIPATGNIDETGDIARALHVFKGNAIERERLEADKEESRLERKQVGDAERKRLVARARELEDLGEQNRIARAEA